MAMVMMLSSPSLARSRAKVYFPLLSSFLFFNFETRKEREKKFRAERREAGAEAEAEAEAKAKAKKGGFNVCIYCINTHQVERCFCEVKVLFLSHLHSHTHTLALPLSLSSPSFTFAAFAFLPLFRSSSRRDRRAGLPYGYGDGRVAGWIGG